MLRSLLFCWDLLKAQHSADPSTQPKQTVEKMAREKDAKEAAAAAAVVAASKEVKAERIAREANDLRV